MFWKRLDWKYYFLIVLCYTLLLTVAIGCLFLQSERVYRQLEFSYSADYEYIFETKQSVKQNDYLNCSSVTFYPDNNLNGSLNVECFMVMDSSKYQSASPFLLQKELGLREIAITYNVAQQYGFREGSVVYSKHNIINHIEEYTVAEILPICYGIIRTDHNLNRGVIVMGYDEMYENNTNYSYIGFCEGDPTKLIIDTDAGLISLTAKSKQESPIFEELLLWQTVVSACVIGSTIIYAVIHWKFQRVYYAGLTIKGSPPEKIKTAIFLDVVLPGATGILFALFLSVLIDSLCNFYLSFAMPLLSAAIGMVVLLASASICSLKRRR